MLKTCERVLVIEGEQNTLDLITSTLSFEGFKVISATNGLEGLTLIKTHDPDVVILDLNLPDMNGIEIIEAVRFWTMLPIIVISDRKSVSDEICVLNMGADDYLTKPFYTSKLLAHVRAVIRRRQNDKQNPDFIHRQNFVAGDLTVDYDKNRVLVADRLCSLTNNEYLIVALLAKYAGRVLTYEFILETLWGPTARENPDGHHRLHVHIGKIRRKIGENPQKPQYIFNEPKVGYRMIEADN